MALREIYKLKLNLNEIVFLILIFKQGIHHCLCVVFTIVHVLQSCVRFVGRKLLQLSTLFF